MKYKIDLIIWSIFLIVTTSIVAFQLGHNEGYDSGYFYGWHESQFIDCSKPDINQTMRVIHYDRSIEGTIREDYFEWEDLCLELNLSKKE